MTEAIFWLTLCVYHEARGEPFSAQVGVAHVVLTRAEQRGKSTKEVVLEPYQFEWANGGKRPPIKDYDAFVRCSVAAKKARNERLLGRTLSYANHFHDTSIPPPSWTKNLKFVTQIGKLIFYRS